MALGGVLLSGFVGHKMGTHMASGMGRAGRLGTIGGMSVAGVGFGVARTGMKVLQQGTQFTNPMFNNVSGQAFGKRGIDANNLNTKGLTLALHNNRRKTR